MIVRVHFENGDVMMFGTSYKPWTMQFDEYCWNNKDQINDIEKVEVSNSKWIGWGGLKWCSEEKFQHQLNREECQYNEPDNPAPRQYNEMKFYHNRIFENIAIRIHGACKNNQTDTKAVYEMK